MSDSAPYLPRQVISCETALTLLNAAIAAARDKSVALSIAIVDSAGHLVTAVRMDGAAFVTIEIARGKAFACAATGGQPGGALAGRYNDNPMVWGNAASLGYGAPMLPSRGALPVFMNDTLIAAIGASGAPSEVDEAVLAAAIEAIGATTKL
jgi:uncharacterized protein GlcG (DUF336 family)